MRLLTAERRQGRRVVRVQDRVQVDRSHRVVRNRQALVHLLRSHRVVQVRNHQDQAVRVQSRLVLVRQIQNHQLQIVPVRSLQARVILSMPLFTSQQRLVVTR